MEESSFFNDVDGDRIYYAEDFAEYFIPFFTNGIFNNGCQVLGNTNDMAVNVSTGRAFINGYRYRNKQSKTLTIENADGVLSRIDNIVIRLDLTNRNISTQVIKGSFSNNPVAPDLTRTSTIYDLRIAKVSIPAGATEITQDLIEDCRFINSDCGNVISPIKTPDTEQLFIQMQAIFDKFIADSTNGFDTWFDSIKNQLDSDAAGNLQNQINNLNSNKVDNATYDLDSKNLQLLANGEKTGDSVHIPTGITDEVSGEEDLKIVNNKGVVKFSLDGKTSQKSYTGKNVLPNNATSQTINGITYTVNPDYSVHIKGTATARSEFDIYNKQFTLNANTKYKFQTDIFMILKTNSEYISGNKDFSFTKDKEISIIKAYIRVEANQTIDKIIYPMITLATITDDTYEPYCGGQSTPNPDYSQEIKNVRGVENLANINDIQIGKQWNNLDNASRASICLIPCKHNTTYTLSGDISSNSNLTTLRIIISKDKKTSIGAYSGTFTTLDDTNYISIEILSSTTITSDMLKDVWIQLEEGPIAHDYVLYGSNYLQLKNTTDNESKIINIDLKGNELCSDKEQTLKDELIIENGRARIIKKYDEYVFTGNEGFGFADNNTKINTDSTRLSILSKVYIETPNKNNNVTPLFCTHYKSSTQLNTKPGSNTVAFASWNGTICFYFPADYSTIDEFKTWLKSQYDSGNPVKVQYQLAEPQTIDLGEVDLDLLEGNSTLNVEEELKPTISVKYYTDSTVVDLKNEVVKKQNKVLSGTTVPNQSLGEDGDIYFQYGS